MEVRLRIQNQETKRIVRSSSYSKVAKSIR